MTEVGGDQPAQFQLPAKLNTAASEALFEAFQAHRGAALQVDAAQVTHLGTLCVQVLLSAQKTWDADQQELHISDCSNAFIADLDRLGIPKHLFVEGD
jgi:anti-anti-sigma regulatory factor